MRAPDRPFGSQVVGRAAILTPTSPPAAPVRHDGGVADLRRAPDEDLLLSGETRAFEEFPRRHVDAVSAYFARRVDPQLAIDLTAETFAAALVGRRRYRPDRGSPEAWLRGIAAHKLSDALRRRQADDRARRRLGMERIEATTKDVALLAQLRDDVRVEVLLDGLPAAQRAAVRRHVVEGRPYEELATAPRRVAAGAAQAGQRALAALRRDLEARG